MGGRPVTGFSVGLAVDEAVNPHEIKGFRAVVPGRRVVAMVAMMVAGTVVAPVWGNEAPGHDHHHQGDKHQQHDSAHRVTPSCVKKSVHRSSKNSSKNSGH